MSSLCRCVLQASRLLLLLAIALGFVAGYAVAATFTVNSTGDGDDAVLNGTCATSTGECTLRAAIAEANNTSPSPSPYHVINFSIAGCPGGICRISLLSLLPDIVQPVFIDGTTQAGNSTVCTAAIPSRPTYAIVLDGSKFYGVKLRLESGSSGSTIRGLNLQYFTDAIAIIRSSNNTIACNFVGTDENGGALTVPGSNLNAVIIGCDSGDNMIGGPAAGDGNLFSGSEYVGVQINGNIPCVSGPGAPTPDDNYVLGNFIGTLKDGKTPYGNMGYSGVAIFDGTGPKNNMVGVKPNGSGGWIRGANVIGANAFDGVYIGPGVTGTVIAGNFLGTNPAGDNVGNGYDGVYSEGGPGNRIGGPDPLDANQIAFNAVVGVVVHTAAGAVTDASGNRIQRNSIYANGTIGIDLGDDGPTPNDPGDVDTGPNGLQNFPVLSSAAVSGPNIVVTYSVPAGSYPLTIEFFKADASGAQGKVFLGEGTYSAAGTATATIPAGSIVAGDILVATATDADGNTSEFSAGVSAGQGPTAIPTLPEWGLIVFMVIAGLSSVYRLRRQRRTESQSSW